MFQRRRELRGQRREAERRERARLTIPIPSTTSRRAFIRAIVDPRVVEVSELPDMDRLRAGQPDLAASLEALLAVLDGLCADVDYLMREAPQARCSLTTDLRLLIADLEEKLKMVDKDKMTFQFGPWKIPLRFTMLIAVGLALLKLYGSDITAMLFAVIPLLLFPPGLWWTLGVLGLGLAVAGLTWRKRTSAR